ncbi:MAG: nitroreductase [Lachnospira sp.]|nr:nitroreductase [Lachnospira sp.]
MFFDDVKNRRSVRTFDGKGVSADLLKDLEDYSKTITNPYDIPVDFLFLNAKENGLSSPVINGEEEYILTKVKAVKNADLAFGYSFQDLLMYAESKGLGNVMIGGTMPRDKFEAAAGITDGELMPCVSPLGVAAKKMGVKEVLMRKGIKADTRFPFTKLFFNGDFNKSLDEDEARRLGIYEALEAVRLAPSAVNKQPWIVVVSGNVAHFYEKKDKGYDNGRYDLQKVDLGIALYNFSRGLEELGKKAEIRISDPGLEIEANTEYIASYAWN